MPRSTRNRKNLQLKTIPVTPFGLAKGYASSMAARIRSTVELAQRVAATVKSVDVVSDQVQVNFAPEQLDGRSLVKLQLGRQDLGLRGDFKLEQQGQEVLLTLKLDAYVLDQVMGRKLGTLVSQATCHFNTRIKIVLQETIDVDSAGEPLPPRKRLRKG